MNALIGMRFARQTICRMLGMLALYGATWGATYAAELRALIQQESLQEISGMARAHRGDRESFWLHNDSGSGAQLFRITPEGQLVGSVLITGATPRDWEDMASFVLDGVAGLLIADTGDNGGTRRDVSLVAVREPASFDDTATLPVAWQRTFNWPDGPRDVEALAVDAPHRQILLISKKRVPAELWSLPLPDWNAPRIDRTEPRRIATLAGIEQPTVEALSSATPSGRYRAQVTAVDIDPSGRWLAVLTYQRVYLYERHNGEEWADAVQRDPRRIDFGWLPQAEALCFDAHERAIWVTSERLPAPLLRLPF
ncbi:MAG: hypothetical protein R3F04_03315 [Lysobacteraceae bacterium]